MRGDRLSAHVWLRSNCCRQTIVEGSSLYFWSPENKLDLRIEEPMHIFIHRKENAPKPVNNHLTLKAGPKIKSENIRRFPAHDLL